MISADAEALRQDAPALPPGQGFRALTDRWTRPRVEKIVELLHGGDRAALRDYLNAEISSVEHATDPQGFLDLKGLHFESLPYRVDLGRVRFERLNLWSSRFENVSLKDARFERCAIGLSVFVDAYLRGVEVNDCDMHGCTFTRTNLKKMRFSSTALRYSTWSESAIDISAFPDELEEEKAGKFAQARDLYKALRLNLHAVGDSAGASWAAYKQQRMDRLDRRCQRRHFSYFASVILDALWGYGERPSRLFIFSVLFCVLFAFGYFFTGLTVGGQCVSMETLPDKTAHFGRCFYFSFVTFTTLGYGDLSPCTLGARSLAVIQAFSGVFIMGLFVSANVRKLSGS